MTNEETRSAIGQIEAGALNYREMRELAAAMKIEIPAVIAKKELSALLIERLNAAANPGNASSPQAATGPGADPPPSPARPHGRRPAELVMNEDLDVVAVYEEGAESPGLMRRLGGLRGAAAMRVVRSVEELAAAEGYVVRRSLRRIGGSDYGLK